MTVTNSDTFDEPENLESPEQPVTSNDIAYLVKLAVTI